MRNHHEQGVFAQFSELLRTWADRHERRRELTKWSERDLHDIGRSWSDVAFEAEKPFWRA